MKNTPEGARRRMGRLSGRCAEQEGAMAAEEGGFKLFLQKEPFDIIRAAASSRPLIVEAVRELDASDQTIITGKAETSVST